MKASVKTSEVAKTNEAELSVKPLYLESLTLVERLHRRLLDVIKDEFERRGRDDVNSVQALLLYNIGDAELSASELRTRGYYLGSNVSYNVKKLVELGYLHHARSRIDRRSVRISLTQKGSEVHDIVKGVYDKHVRTVEQIGWSASGPTRSATSSDASCPPAGRPGRAGRPGPFLGERPRQPGVTLLPCMPQNVGMP